MHKKSKRKNKKEFQNLIYSLSEENHSEKEEAVSCNFMLYNLRSAGNLFLIF
jgi:hypothetical protein